MAMKFIHVTLLASLASLCYVTAGPYILTSLGHVTAGSSSVTATSLDNSLMSSTQSAPTCPTPEPERITCTTSQCYSTASRLLSLMNLTADPCEDFYSYACGGVDSPTLLADDLSVDVWRRMERAVNNINATSPAAHKKFKNYYHGCVQYDSLVPMEDRKTKGKLTLDSIGIFRPKEDQTLTSENITDLLIKLFQHGSAPLFDLRLDTDYENPTRFKVVLSPSSHLFSGSHFLSAEEKTKRCRHMAGDRIDMDANKVYKDYLRCVQEIFLNTTEKALTFFDVDNENIGDILDSIKDIIFNKPKQEIKEFFKTTEKALKSVGVNNENIGDILDSIKDIIFNKHKVFTAEEIDNAIQSKKSESLKLSEMGESISEYNNPVVNWKTLLNTLLNTSELDDVDVEVISFDKIKQMFSDLHDTSRKRRMYNALLAVFAHDLYNELVTSHHSCDRESYCLQVAASLMPSVAANLYISTFPDSIVKELKEQVSNKASQLYNTTLTIIERLPEWMDTLKWTEQNVDLKVRNMISFPEKFNEADVANSLKKCPLDKKDYFEDSICLLKEFQKQLYSRFTKDTNSSEAMWLHFSLPFSTETTYVYGLDVLLIPLAVIGPVFDPEMPQHIQAARLGNLVARGYGHAFDRTGMKFPTPGQYKFMGGYYLFRQMVEDAQLNKKASLLEDGLEYNFELDPDLALNVQLADITAAYLSLRIVNENDISLPWVPFSPKQVYFIHLAQEFCSKKKFPEMIPSIFEGLILPRHRVENIVKNSEEFANVFTCSETSSMNKYKNSKIKPFPLYEDFEPPVWHE